MPIWTSVPAAVRSAAADRAGYLRRAVRSEGRERDDLILGAKTVVAAMTAWTLARYLLPPAVSTFAPFAALLALQSTVYRSVRECAQYALAMAAGATLAATLAAVAGIHGWTFGILTLSALVVGRIQRFGEQGTQVAVVGFFAFSSGQGEIDYVGHLVASVGIGALCGLAAHLVLAPARHTVHRQQAVAELYTTMGRRLDGLAGTLEASDPDRDHTSHWRRDGRLLASECERLRHGIETEIENGRLNPRRSIDGAERALPRAREAVAVAERSTDHLRSMTRTLDHALAGRELDGLSPAFRTGLGSVLRAAARAMREIGRPTRTDPGRLDELIDAAAEELDKVQRADRAAAAASPDVHAVQGTLLTDAGRLLADLRSGGRTLAGTS
ncbi:aromatic acid exporter family protein [Streptomyces sp. NPDC058662]|uniref:aromatic acid exporter family protein n=1 Tax=Streptomyces sp. NPDC058662 TaxID=3346583 RepID=UPI003648A0C1